ncbi:pecanex-like protein 1 isoform X2 [Tribolium castaneum]|uniref:pecanex-like protein 1 isoform X2 n=1 Tax=Tribolium castaneum TaxID=7070 RepID=UPI0030FEE838
MIEEQQMGSQTLEILRQGVWASLTGGWFFDPHQDVFCNTFHLYIWLFLLCLPFTIYVYFPPTKYMWYFYCLSVTIVLAVIKLVNYGLHHMYDTSECIHEEIDENWQEVKREEEGIELQVLSNKTETNSRPAVSGSFISYAEAGALPSTDADSLESTEFQQAEAAKDTKPSSTIDLKAEVHRKNSSESSDGAAAPVLEIVTYQPDVPERKPKKSDRRPKHQRSKTDGFVCVRITDDTKPNRSSFRKLYQQADSADGNLLIQRPSLQSVDCEQGPSSGRRHSNFTNSSLNFLPSTDIKPTGSLELGYLDKNPSEGFYFKTNGRGGVRRIRSTALETCCPPPALIVHPNSLEVIGCKGARNPLPPPSSSLVRNQHLNLCSYYGSEIVYPIAEQSDEHQTSHGPDTDIDSSAHISDSDFEENQGSNSPLFYITVKTMTKNVPYEKTHPKIEEKCSEERTSATSKDALLDNDNSNSSATPEMHDARTDCYGTDNECSDKKLSECSNLSCSNTSVECDERSPKIPNCPFSVRKLCHVLGDDFRVFRDQVRDNNVRVVYAKNDVLVNEPHIFRKRNVKRNRRRKSGEGAKTVEKDNCTSLVELDLDWLFDDENQHNQHKKEPLKRDTEWSSTTTVSLEHDVNKVLQEQVPSTRSLGAIPKKTRSNSSHNDQSSGRKTPKSESEKCSMCRCKSDENEPRNRSLKENKLTQTLRQNDCPSSVEGLECIVLQKPQRVDIPKRYVRTSRDRNEEGSSGGSNNELSTLLPPAPLLSAFLASRRDYPLSVCYLPPSETIKFSHVSPQRNRLKRSRVSRRRSCQRNKRDSAIASSLSAGHGTHCAKNFNDTTDGSVHCFMDEHGNWITYTFDEKGLGTANNRLHEKSSTGDKPHRRRPSDAASTSRGTRNNSQDFCDSNSTDSICNSSVSIILDAPASKTPSTSMIPLQNSDLSSAQMKVRDTIRRRLFANQGFIDPLDSLISIVQGENEGDVETNLARNQFKFIQNSDQVNNNYPRTKSFYKFKVFPWTYVKVTLDRLKLLALLDRNLTFFETLLSIGFGILVSVSGAILLYYDFYEDLLAFIFCFVMASCQYSLLKSVQPDAASPTHGFNRIIAYSRPIYFCICAGIILILDSYIDKSAESQVYSLSSGGLTHMQVLLLVRDFLIKFILFFPVLFSLGLFPQINTFIMYLLEQVDMHIFGGNAMSSLLASFYCIFRSLLAVIVMNGFAYGGLSEPKSSQHILFSIFCACLVACSYHLSRSASDPSHLWNIVKRHVWPSDIYREHSKDRVDKVESKEEKPLTEKQPKKSVKFPSETSEKVNDHVDPLPHKLQKTVNARLKNDIILCGLIAVLVFSVHASTVFTALQPELSPVLWTISAVLGFVLHYVTPQLRKQLPWLCIASPVLRSRELLQYQIRGPAKIMWFERVYIYLCFVERNILYPLLFLSVLTEDSPKVVKKFGPLLGSFVVVICGLKCLRSSYSNQSCQYLVLTFTALAFRYDYSFMEQTFLVQYFFVSIVFHKFYELLLKVQFVVTYIAPWQITWGSAFHAFAQPFSVPHSAMLFLQAFISAILSTPLNPFLGSAIFLTSYVRPIKFWERDYNTRRVDHSNTPLSSHLDRNLGADDNNLNSIFYEHLTRSLQHSLCGDLILGRWGLVSQGDCFVLASDYLNCLVHIIELGNGLVTFQMRGLEFKGTYCQQREVEAITEGIEENHDHFTGILSISSAFSQRWLAWEVIAAKYILEGYSISDNSAVSMLQVFEFRKVLISYYVKSIIFYTVRSPKLEEWLSSQTILSALQPMEHKNFVDLDPVFNYNIDEDFDIANSGMTRHMFCQIHGEWISFCVEKAEKNVDSGNNSTLVLLCFALSLLGRRALGAVSHNTVSSVEFFLFGLHALFKGDFRITCARDEWVFTDMDLLKTVVAPGIRMSLKLHQDHFMSPDEYEELPALYDAICKHEEELVISHEGDPAWRNAVLSGTPSLLALRHVLDDGSDEYKIIMLNKRYLSFRVIKINKECVRGLWAGQQQELVYLRNRNPERGSIQNAKQALRNIINSSCDQPIGYPIYVSPLTTSYAETNEQYCSLVGGSVSLTKIKNYIFNVFRRIRKRCGEGCSSGASARDEIGMGHEGVYAMTTVTPLNHQTAGSQSTDGSHLSGSMGRGSSLSRTSLGGNRGSLVSVGKPTSATLASLAGLFKERDERAVSQTPDGQPRNDEFDETAEKEYSVQRVRIVDPNLVYDAINLGRRIDVTWPTEYMRVRGGRSFWKDWVPETGMEGPVVHRWTPCHKDPGRRSHVDRTILLVQIDDKFVPIAESGVQDLGQEV